jgi:hypothetical protein
MRCGIIRVQKNFEPCTLNLEPLAASRGEDRHLARVTADSE